MRGATTMRAAKRTSSHDGGEEKEPGRSAWRARKTAAHRDGARWKRRKKQQTTATHKRNRINMKALILVGGYGSRLLPLTYSIPKPLVDFANKPILQHQVLLNLSSIPSLFYFHRLDIKDCFHNLSRLRHVGVTEIVLAINYRPEAMYNFLKDSEDNLGVRITCSQETEPLGTAGPLALARDKLVDGSGEPFFVLNCDIISEYHFAELIRFHKSHVGEATIMVTKVDEPSKYGVVIMEEGTGRVERFVEKPKTFVGDKINAGIYLLDPSVLDRVQLKPTSVEKENSPDRLAAAGEHVVGNVLVHETASIGDGCLIGPDVVVGPGCVVEDGVRLSRCTLLRGARVKKHACVSSGGTRASASGRASRNVTVLGEGVHVCDEVYSNGGLVEPRREIRSNIPNPKVVK
ncbi:hypothetical protein PR202_ga01635 [Eleusine coracana subsp. coracana]|uniref:mannose-1-phosphate guanylyltransferase n=1 Tax=Eleusine coracana subsp. coracana TaxID=191504 RepID=A0AAV5BHU5_ELECO|nr:hypothetical protein PR202_ga00948 [Eleusine coracana subsp. coracana]GJM85833.1 hypothetical protein PR202_ga01635 [Eleusine coracana subsp. coracana]